MDFTTLAGKMYFGKYQGLYKAEWRAVYYENILRSQLGMNLRQYYGLNVNAEVPGYKATGPNLLDQNMKQINYPAYPRLLLSW